MMETYYGHVKTPADAIKLFEACRLGMLPRVQRRLSEKERQAIRSGSVFVWDEREAGMRRWTDGKSWSASRVSGSFLTYREMEGKRASGFGGSGGRRTAGKTPDSGRGSDEDQDDGEPDGYRYKADGLMKQSFSITTSQGQHLHLISYYSRGDSGLLIPTADPQLRSVVPLKGLYPESNLNEPSGPATMRAPMHQQPMYGPLPQAPPHPAYHPPPYSQPPPPYSQPSVAWPPSPVTTPPYTTAHYHHPPQPYPPPTLPPPQQHHAAGPPLSYSHGPGHQYDRLPPPQPAPPLHHKPGMTLPQPYPTQNQSHSPHQQYQHPHPHQQHQQHHQHHPHQHQQQQQQQQQQQPPPPPPPPQQHIPSPHSSHAVPPRISPRISHLDSLQAAAQAAVMNIDPQLATNQQGRSQQGPLPSPGQQQSQNTMSTLSPPLRTQSTSPPGNQASEGKGTNGQAAGNGKVSLSAILHPVSARSESGGSKPGTNGDNGSPRAPSGGSANGTSPRNGREVMEARAIGALDKTFCMT